MINTVIGIIIVISVCLFSAFVYSANIKKGPYNYKKNVAAKVNVCVETHVNKNLIINFRHHGIFKESKTTGNNIGLKSGLHCFEFFSNDEFPREEGEERAPASIPFSMEIPRETSTRYNFDFVRLDTYYKKNVEMVKYMQSNYPEDVTSELITQDLSSKLFKDKKKLFGLHDGWRFNDFVHHWDMDIKYEPPSDQVASGLYTVNLLEIPISKYFTNQKLEMVANAIKNNSLSELQLNELSEVEANSSNETGVTLLHWAIRFENIRFINWYIKKQYLPKQAIEIQGVPIVMAVYLKSPNLLLHLLKGMKLSNEDYRPLEIPFLIGARSDAVEIFKLAKDYNLLSIEGLRHSYIQFLEMMVVPRGVTNQHNISSEERVIKYFQLLTFLSSEAKYPNPISENSLADSSLSTLADFILLLDTYKKNEIYQDRIESKNKDLELLQQNLNKMIASGVPITPGGVSFVLYKSFFTNFASINEPRILRDSSQIELLWPLVFDSKKSYEKFRSIAMNDQFIKELEKIVYLQKINAEIVKTVIDVRNQYIKSGYPASFKIGKFYFVVIKGQLKIHDIDF